jgi:hypothetical protein
MQQLSLANAGAAAGAAVVVVLLSMGCLLGAGRWGCLMCVPHHGRGRGIASEGFSEAVVLIIVFLSVQNSLHVLKCTKGQCLTSEIVSQHLEAFFSPAALLPC